MFNLPWVICENNEKWKDIFSVLEKPSYKNPEIYVYMNPHKNNLSVYLSWKYPWICSDHFDGKPIGVSL